MPAEDRFFPGRAPVDAYGNGGFRFAEMSHRGSLLLLPSGIYAWEVSAFEELSPRNFDRAIAEAEAIDFLLLGTGTEQLFPPPSLREPLEAAGIGLEVMDTGAACRTWNILLAEERAVAAALIAVE